MRKDRKADWIICSGLLTLSLLPIVAGVVRLLRISTGASTAENSRFLEAPWPITFHIAGAIIFCVLGAFQFAPDLRRRNIRWHRLAGRIALPAGFITALSGMWMAQFYPNVGFDGSALYALRMLVGALMTLFLWLATQSILKLNIPQHQAWMIRAYALGLGAGTQVLTHIPWFLLPDMQSELFRTLSMGAGWGLNMIVAELIIRWPSLQASRKYPASILEANGVQGQREGVDARASKR